ncbi:hypothetical protein HD806DRAFT_488179 [Xylariaceae sp. AK1471]|nr:hypothetical protein HD806DRAFT_488179 [Xylariaceae sp. AK1471]
MADAAPPPLAGPPPVSNTLPWLRRAQIVNFGPKYTFPPYPEHGLCNYLADVEPVDNEIYVLNLLQRTRTTSVEATALQLTLNALLNAVPQPIQERVDLHVGAREEDRDTGPVIGQLDWFSQDDGAFENTVADLEDGSIPSLKSNNKEFILWVVDAGTPDHQHYVTIVLHYEPSNPWKPEILDRIGHWAVVDALDNNNNVSLAQFRTSARVKRLFRRHDIDPALERTIWVPPQQEGEGFASGLLAYAVIAQLLDRIGIMHCTGGYFDEGAFFSPTRPWFNPDAVRAETLGLAATKAMEKLRWKARLALFPVAPFADSQGEFFDPTKLAPSQAPPPAHNIPSDVDSLFEEKGKDEATQTDQAAPEPSLVYPISSTIPSSDGKDDVIGQPIDEDSPELQWYLNRKQEDIEREQAQVQRVREASLQATNFAERLQMEVLNAPNNNVPTSWAVEALRGLIHRAQVLHASAKLLIDVVNTDYHPEFHAIFLDRLEQQSAYAELEEQYYEDSGTLDPTVEILFDAVAARGDCDCGDDEPLAEGVQVGGSDDGDKRVSPQPQTSETGRSPKKPRFNYKMISRTGPDGRVIRTLIPPKRPRTLNSVSKRIKK